MPHAYTEDQRVERPAIGLFAELGWAVAGPSSNAGVTGDAGRKEPTKDRSSQDCYPYVTALTACIKRKSNMLSASRANREQQLWYSEHSPQAGC